MNNLLAIITEQSAIQFTGRINILGAQKELLGHISLYKGNLVNARRLGRSNVEHLYYFGFLDLDGSGQSYIVEPEVIAKEERLFELSEDGFKQNLSKYYSEYQKIKKLRPPESIKLLAKPSFLPVLKAIHPEEFDLLSVITTYPSVKDIYFYSPFSPLKTTKLLVALRKLDAIAVINK